MTCVLARYSVVYLFFVIEAVGKTGKLLASCDFDIQSRPCRFLWVPLQALSRREGQVIHSPERPSLTSTLATAGILWFLKPDTSEVRSSTSPNPGPLRNSAHHPCLCSLPKGPPNTASSASPPSQRPAVTPSTDAHPYRMTVYMRSRSGSETRLRCFQVRPQRRRGSSSAHLRRCSKPSGTNTSPTCSRPPRDGSDGRRTGRERCCTETRRDPLCHIMRRSRVRRSAAATFGRDEP